MLRNSFIHIPGIGRTTEKFLWDEGLRDWDMAYAAARAGRLSGKLGDSLKEYIPESKKALSNKEFGFFGRLLRLDEVWRFYVELASNCVFLDIETTGLSPFFDRITVVGLYDGNRYKAFVYGQNLEAFLTELKKYAMVVTFNGSLFDLRFIKAHFPIASIPIVHMDLRFAARRLGLTGGLKVVEQELGIERPGEIRRLSGYDATVLWSRYVRGDKSALELLIKYNMQDVLSLRTISKIVYERLRKATLPFQKAYNSQLDVDKLRTDIRRCLISKGNGVKQYGNSPKTDSNSQIVFRLVTRAATSGQPPRIVGIDLTGSRRRASGLAFLVGPHVTTKLLKTDRQLIRETVVFKPDLVSIDSPLSLPTGYPRHKAIYRQCERALKSLGISVYWCLLPSMRKLTMRGIKLAKEFRGQGIAVIESYPGAAQDVLLIPRKKASTEELKWGLVRAGFKGNWVDGKISHDELDAITSGLVGLFYLADEYIALGNAKEDYLIIPRTHRLGKEKLSKLSDILAHFDLDRPVSVNSIADRQPSEALQTNPHP